MNECTVCKRKIPFADAPGWFHITLRGSLLTCRALACPAGSCAAKLLREAADMVERAMAEVGMGAP